MGFVHGILAYLGTTPRIPQRLVILISPRASVIRAVGLLDSPLQRFLVQWDICLLKPRISHSDHLRLNLAHTWLNHPNYCAFLNDHFAR